MINTILKKLDFWSGSDNTDVRSRRQYVRYNGQVAKAIVGNDVCTVNDWSMNSAFFSLPFGQKVSAGDKISVIMSFGFPHEVVEVAQTGAVIRTGINGVAVRFFPNDATNRQMARVVDNQNTQDFLQSQVG